MKIPNMLLGSGRVCQWECPRVLFLRHYFVLTFPQEHAEPTETEETEMLGRAVSKARDLATDLFQNPEAFVMIHSGRSNRRAHGWHIHVVLIKNRWQKAWLYFVLFGKNILQAIGLRRDRYRQK